MIGLSSSSAGVLCLPKPGTDAYIVLDVVDGTEQDPAAVQYLYSSVQDWIEIDSPDAKSLLEIATREYWLERAVSLLRLAISGLGSSLEGRILEHVEEILSTRVTSMDVLNRLLIAPISNKHSSIDLTKSALSKGYSAVAAILDELSDLQPLLRRFSDLWLGLPDIFFSQLLESKENIWVTLIEKCKMNELLKVNSRREFTVKWNLLAYYFNVPQSRSGIQAIGQQMAGRLFPSEDQVVTETTLLTDEDNPAQHYKTKQPISNYELFEQAKKQIAAIAQAVSEGRDAKAEKFLRELIKQQTSYSGGADHTIKSLCNIAKQCADMFRMDFEIICLNEALSLNRSDPWTLIQYGDHLKRVGNYADALKYFDQAEKLGAIDDESYARACVADVYSQKGEYTKAIQTYKTIPSWDDIPQIRTAIADNLRKMGNLEGAQDAYNQLINSALQGSQKFADSVMRSHAGLAEIEKRQGNLNDSLQTYKEILASKDIGDRDRIFYKLGLCNILKLMEKYDDAYTIIDEVIRDYPFAMEARFIRGSILGLIGKELDGLKDLPESSEPHSWREWLRSYYRGLLLLKLKRYDDARKILVEELSNAIASEEEKAIIRMAAALCFLRENNTSEGDRVLSEITSLYDCHTQYLSLVLKLHLATQKADLITINSLRAQIIGLKVIDTKLQKAIAAISQKNFALALTIEIDALLKLAAA